LLCVCDYAYNRVYMLECMCDNVSVSVSVCPVWSLVIMKCKALTVDWHST